MTLKENISVTTSDPASRHADQRSRIPHHSQHQVDARASLARLLLGTPIPVEELPANLPLYLQRETLAQILAAEILYRRILDVPGAIMEFGTRWGRRLALFLALRELYEPYNFSRVVVGFDTFSGFPEVGEYDGGHPDVYAGSMAVTDGYSAHLEQVLMAHEHDSMLAHIRRYDLRSGDVHETLPDYLAAHPETLVSLAYFDLDLYRPTRTCLELIRPRLTRGSVLAFDELGHASFPGETRAILDALALPTMRLEKLSFHPYPVFMTW
jgi:hypothetical protein